jgi:GNAT superfamily N-acetyltransferase
MITFRNEIPEKEYNDMRENAGWRRLGPEQARTGLDNSAYLISAWDEERPVGIARVISDMGYIYLIADVIVIPKYQGCGIGRSLLEHIEAWLNEIKKQRPTIMVYLMAAEGKEGFYEKFGFRRRPGADHMGAGMSKWIDDPKTVI